MEGPETREEDPQMDHSGLTSVMETLAAAGAGRDGLGLVLRTPCCTGSRRYQLKSGCVSSCALLSQLCLVQDSRLARHLSYRGVAECMTT
jgi:hypothetical protein